MFNPFGWMADEAGANWAALAQVWSRCIKPYYWMPVSLQAKRKQACKQTY